MPIPTDAQTLGILHGAMVLVLVIALIAEVLARRRAGFGGASMVVGRGEQSMARLTGSFAFIVGLYWLTIDVASAPKEGKSALIVVDCVVWAYLFFYNVWFRNHVIGATSARSKEAR